MQPPLGSLRGPALALQPQGVGRPVPSAAAHGPRSLEGSGWVGPGKTLSPWPWSLVERGQGHSSRGLCEGRGEPWHGVHEPKKGMEGTEGGGGGAQ